MSRRLIALLLPIAAALPFLGPINRAAAQDEDDCGSAITVAATRHHLPEGLLQAIAETESGRYDPRSNARIPWPWTVTARGTGRFFATKADAIVYVRDLWANGITSIDVGCLQVNLHYHPAAFATLAQAFDPSTNADYAATFLTTLHRPDAGWSEAVADYHSASPIEGGAYLQRVMVNLSGPTPIRPQQPRFMTAAVVLPAPDRFGITVITPDTAVLPSRRRLPRIITP